MERDRRLPRVTVTTLAVGGAARVVTALDPSGWGGGQFGCDLNRVGPRSIDRFIGIGVAVLFMEE